MDAILTIFNNREKAVIIWVLIVCVCLLFSKNLRPSLLALVKSLFARKIITALFIMAAYISLVVFIAYKLHLWDISLLKDTLVWVLGSAVVLFMNYDKVTTEKKYLRGVMLDNVKLVALLEFIVNLYAFNFIVEFLLVPVLVFIGTLLAVSETKKEYTPVKILLQVLLGSYGIFLISYTVFQAVGNVKDIATLYNFKDFLLSPLLTVSFLPFVYFLAVYAAYDSLFTRVDILLRDQHKALIRFTKWQILRACLFRLKNLNRFSREYIPQLMTIENKDDTIHLTRHLKRSSSKDER